MDFKWDEWNEDHIARHAVAAAHAEFVVRHARRPYPRRGRDGCWVAWGQDQGGRYLQVAFSLVFDELDLEDKIYVFHARELTSHE